MGEAAKIQVRLDPVLLARLDGEAELRTLSRNRVVVVALESWLAQYATARTGGVGGVEGAGDRSEPSGRPAAVPAVQPAGGSRRDGSGVGVEHRPPRPASAPVTRDVQPMFKGKA